MAQALAAEGEAHEHALRQLRAEAAAARAAAASAPPPEHTQSTTAAAAAAALRRAEAAEGRAANSSIAERAALVRAPRLRAETCSQVA
jgi:hypothetical protein